MILIVGVGLLFFGTCLTVIVICLTRSLKRISFNHSIAPVAPKRLYVDPLYVKQEIAVMEQALKSVVGE